LFQSTSADFEGQLIVNQKHPFAQDYFTSSDSAGLSEAESFAIQSWNLSGSTSQLPGQNLDRIPKLNCETRKERGVHAASMPASPVIHAHPKPSGR
jgi:hypothetical protein